MSDSSGVFSWLLDGIESSVASIIGDSGVMPLITDSCSSDSCSQDVCSGDSSGSCTSYTYVCSDSSSCTDDSTTNATIVCRATQDSVTITITGMSSPSKTRYWRFKTYTSSGTLVSTTTTSNSSGITSISHTITGLSAGTSYRVEIDYGPSTSYSYSLDDASFTTLSYDYTLSFTTSATATSISATVALTSGATAYDVDCTFYLDGARALDATISAGSLSRTRTWVTSIEPATAYKITLTDNLRDKSWDITRRTKNNFAWSTDVSQGAEFILLASDWNEYTSQLKAKASYYGKSYSPATVSTGEALTATKVNNIAAVINWMVDNDCGDCTTKVGSVSAGDAVTAAKINLLATCLNQ